MDSSERLAAYDYDLPEERIAQHPPARRRDARLLRWKKDGGLDDARMSDLSALLREGDLLVLNDTRVFPARLMGSRESTGGRVEILLIEALAADQWAAMVRPGRRLKAGADILLDGSRLKVRVEEDLGQGRRRVLFPAGIDATEIAWKHGRVPLPPYIHRKDEEEDRKRYQTVFAREDGSVAAPTAGLHLDEDLLAEIDAKGVSRAFVTLHVGPGTFRPVDSGDLRRGELHAERFHVPEETIDALRACRKCGGRVVAVGTTVCRSLESIPPGLAGRISSQTTLFIQPPFHFQWVDVLLTNFHLPRSSLLMLVAAFAGERWRSAYEHAISQGYRFYSYGDANWIEGKEDR